MTVLAVLLLVFAGWLTFGVLIAVCSVGRPRKPLSPGTAAFLVALSAAEIVLLVFAALRVAS